MAFVKLQCSILNSTLWMDRDARDIFLTALLMAELLELTASTVTLKVGSIEDGGFTIPAGWYGFVPSASTGIIHQARMETGPGMRALQTLSDPDPDSRSPEYGGRRMVRVPGGFVILNYVRFRERDDTVAERQRRFRDRKRNASNAVTCVTVTHVDGDEDRDVDQKGGSEAPVGAAPNVPLPPTENAQQTAAGAALPPSGRWSGGRWLERFRAAWWDAKGRQYGQGEADSRAAGDLTDRLEAIDAPARAALEQEATRVFAAYFAMDGGVANARHPFKWLVERFNEWGDWAVGSTARPAPAASGYRTVQKGRDYSDGLDLFDRKPPK